MCFVWAFQRNKSSVFYKCFLLCLLLPMKGKKFCENKQLIIKGCWRPWKHLCCHTAVRRGAEHKSVVFQVGSFGYFLFDLWVLPTGNKINPVENYCTNQDLSVFEFESDNLLGCVPSVGQIWSNHTHNYYKSN